MRALSEIGVRGLNAMHVMMRTGRPIALAELARSSRAPKKALGALLPKLLTAGLVAREGRRGYVLAKAPGEIRLHDVFEVLEKPQQPQAPCGGTFESCPSRAACVLAVLCGKANDHFRKFLREFTLEDLRDAAPDLPNCMDPALAGKKRTVKASPRKRRGA